MERTLRMKMRKNWTSGVGDVVHTEEVVMRRSCDEIANLMALGDDEKHVMACAIKTNIIF